MWPILIKACTRNAHYVEEKNFLKSLVNIEEGSERLRFRCVSVCDVLSVMKGEVTQTETGFTAAVQRTYVCVCVCLRVFLNSCPLRRVAGNLSIAH